MCEECASMCMTSSLRSAESQTARPQCPKAGCRKQLSDHDLLRLVEPSEVVRLCKIELEQKMALHKDKYGTGCERCGKANHLPPGSTGQGVTCRHCEQPMLLQQVTDELAQDAAGGWKPCPQCKAKVYKVDGCNHMTHNCESNRQTHFCWLCGEMLKLSKVRAHFKDGNSTGCYQWAYQNPEIAHEVQR